jgi:hypothetical protein
VPCTTVFVHEICIAHHWQTFQGTTHTTHSLCLAAVPQALIEGVSISLNKAMSPPPPGMPYQPPMQVCPERQRSNSQASCTDPSYSMLLSCVSRPMRIGLRP